MKLFKAEIIVSCLVALVVFMFVAPMIGGITGGSTTQPGT